MQARFGQAIEHRPMLHPRLPTDILRSVSVELEQISFDQLDLTGLDLDQKHVSAGRQDDQINLPAPPFAFMRGLPGDAVEDLVVVRKRLLQAIEHI